MSQEGQFEGSHQALGSVRQVSNEWGERYEFWECKSAKKGKYKERFRNSEN